MDDQERYDQICSKEFASIRETVEQTLAILKGKNGETPGLCERVRDIERFQRTITRVGGLIGGAVIVQTAASLVSWVVRHFNG